MALKSIGILFLAGCSFAYGQAVSAGVKAGARLGDDIEGSATSESKRYAVGPTVEFALPWHFAVELDALYRYDGYRTYSGDILGSSYFTRTRANSWEFPLLAKRYLPLGFFASGGWAVRALRYTGHTQGVQVDYYGKRTPVDNSFTQARQVSHGAVVGGGFEFGTQHLRVAPEFRYTRWNNRPVQFYGSHGYYINSLQNQFEILVGVRWR